MAGLQKSSVAHFFKQSSSPKKHLPADVLAAIAGALGTTVEYLVTGQEPSAERLPPEIHAIVRLLQGLSPQQLAEVRGYLAGYLESRFGRAAEGGAKSATG